VPLADGGKVSGSATATLVVEPVAYADAGTYAVTVVNACGSDAAEVEVFVVLTGDLNGDAKVDGSDLGLLLATWGPTPVLPSADLNEDGAVDGADLGILLANWG